MAGELDPSRFNMMIWVPRGGERSPRCWRLERYGKDRTALHPTYCFLYSSTTDNQHRHDPQPWCPLRSALTFWLSSTGCEKQTQPNKSLQRSVRFPLHLRLPMGAHFSWVFWLLFHAGSALLLLLGALGQLGRSFPGAAVICLGMMLNTNN